MSHQNRSGIHRIGAQRDLNFSDTIALKHYDQAKHSVYDPQKKVFPLFNTFAETTKLFQDFNDVLSTLVAKDSQLRDSFISQCKKAEEKGQTPPKVPPMTVDYLQKTWNLIFPQRHLVFENSGFYATFENNDKTVRYSANHMSDGERSVLYLASQVLCAPSNKVLIIDEPEVHLHRSIMQKLWGALEEIRQDCLFVYITHDTQFAALHGHADKIWIKEYDGKNWKLERIKDDNLPEELLLDILGSRKPILFVEGEKNSYDVQLYSKLYPAYYVIPCGSCSQVINRTKAFRASQYLHDYEVYGLIDRDFRSDYEIEQYKADHIYTLNVAEVENLFIVEELIRLMATHMGKNPDEVFAAVKNTVSERYKSQVNKQILQSVVAEIKYRLNCAEISKRGEDEAKASLDSLYSDIEYDKIKEAQNERFNAPLASKDYREIIRVFNEKNIAKSIGHFFGINNNDYCAIVVALLQDSKHDEICGAISSYLPPEIPRS